MDIKRRVDEWVGQMLADQGAITKAALSIGVPESSIGTLLAATAAIEDRSSAVEQLQIGR